MPKRLPIRSILAMVSTMIALLGIPTEQRAIAQSPIAPVTYEQPVLSVDPAVPLESDSVAQTSQDNASAPISLRRPGTEPTSADAKAARGGNWVTIAGSLSLVLALFFAVAWVTRRRVPARLQVLPTDVLDVLGRVPLGSRQHAHLVRVGSKLLLVAVSEGGAETLTEITEPVEVQRLTELCQRDVAATTVRESLALGLGRFGRGRTERNRNQTEVMEPELSVSPSPTASREFAERRHA